MTDVLTSDGIVRFLGSFQQHREFGLINDDLLEKYSEIKKVMNIPILK